MERRAWRNPVSEWRELALCAQIDGDLFFPEKGESASLARSVCARCPVSEECLAFALATNEREGIWGGLTARERAQIRREAS